MSKNLAVIALYDRVSKSYSYPMVVEQNMPLLKRELRNQVQSAKSYELSVNYPDKVVVVLGTYDLEFGLLSPYTIDLGVVSFGDDNIVYDHSFGKYKLFDLKSLFTESEDEKVE